MRFNLILFLILGWLLVTSCDLSGGVRPKILAAQNAIKESRFNDAVIVYSQLLEMNLPNHLRIKINYQLGQINYLYLNNGRKALIYYQKILQFKIDPLWQVKILEKIAQIYSQDVKDYRQAANYYQILMNYQPRLEMYDFYYSQYAKNTFNQGNLTKAKDIYTSLLKTSDQNNIADANYYLGLIYSYEKKYEQSINYWYEALKFEKRKIKIVRIKYLIANSYESSEKLKQAYNIYYSLLKEHPNPKLIKGRLESLYARRVARKR